MGHFVVLSSVLIMCMGQGNASDASFVSDDLLVEGGVVLGISSLERVEDKLPPIAPVDRPEAPDISDQ